MWVGVLAGAGAVRGRRGKEGGGLRLKKMPPGDRRALHPLDLVRAKIVQELLELRLGALDAQGGPVRAEGLDPSTPLGTPVC